MDLFPTERMREPKLIIPERGRGPFRERPLKQERIELKRLSERQVLWLVRMMEHGPQNTNYLHEMLERKHIDPTRIAIKQLWRAGYVYRPIQQTHTDNVDYNLYVYDIDEKGIEYLKDHGLWRETYRDHAHWTHQYMISAIQTSIRILAEREGIKYIPQDQYFTTPLATKVPFYWGNDIIESVELNPDPSFVLDYGHKKVIYFLEADRGTEKGEPKSWRKKSLRRSLLQYDYLLGQMHYRQAYNTTDEAKVLFVMAQAGRANNFLTMADKALGQLPWLGVQLATSFGERFEPPKQLLSHLWNDPYIRPGCNPWTLKPLTK